MIRLPNTFDPATGRHSAMSQIPPHALRVEYGETEAVVYEPGDELPVEPTQDTQPDLSLEEQFRALRKELEDEGVIAKREYVKGDDPQTAEVEKGFWRRALEFVGVR